MSYWNHNDYTLDADIVQYGFFEQRKISLEKLTKIIPKFQLLPNNHHLAFCVQKNIHSIATVIYAILADKIIS